MNYVQLKAIIQQFAVDAEPTFLANIPQFIQNAEKRIYNETTLLPVEQNLATQSFAAGVATLAMPADFMSVDNLSIVVSGSKQFLLSKSLDFLDTAYPDPLVLGTPRYYAMVNPDIIKVAPVPSIVFVSQLWYIAYPESITTAPGGTTWLGDHYDYVLQYGALREAAAYLKEEADVVAMYEGLYREALGQIVVFAKDRSTSDQYRRKQGA